VFVRLLSERWGARLCWVAVEFGTLAAPPLVSLTAPETAPFLLCGVLALGGAGQLVEAAALHGRLGEREGRAWASARRAAGLRASQKHFISAWRACLMLTTTVCILAVDFHVFPRRFAKVGSVCRCHRPESECLATG
jgi:hypothetical protein